MSVLVIPANDTFLDITLELPEDVLPPGSCIISRGEPAWEHHRVRRLDVKSWYTFMHPDKINTLNVNSRVQLSENLLRSFADCENTFLSIVDRFCPGKDVWERKRWYYELLLYWYTFFKEGTTKAVVLNWMAHAGWDYVVYCVAKRLGIPVVYAEVTLLDDRIVFLDDYEKVEKVPGDYLSDCSRDEVIEHIGTDLWQDFTSSCSKLERDKRENRQAVSAGPVSQFTTRRIIRPMKSILKRCFSRRCLDHKSSMSGNAGRLFAMEQPRNRVRFYLRKCAFEAKMMSLRRYYDRLAQPVDLSRPFIFFPLHYQPERTTCPMGGAFHDQILAVKTLASAIPREWTIYVKEHPIQFGRDGSSRALFRNRHFYDALNAIPQVQLAALDEESARLVQGAQFVSTLTGSAGWEGLKQGKACVMFGIPWFAPCNSCYIAKSSQQVELAIESIQSKTDTEVYLDVLKYLAYWQGRFVLGGIDPKVGIRSKRDYHFLVKSVAAALATRIREETASGDPCSLGDVARAEVHIST